jgi:hypothetical protein
MTTRELVRRAHALFNVPYVPPSTRRHNRHQWVRSVQRLGDRWLLATQIKRNN